MHLSEESVPVPSIPVVIALVAATIAVSSWKVITVTVADFLFLNLLAVVMASFSMSALYVLALDHPLVHPANQWPA